MYSHVPKPGTVLDHRTSNTAPPILCLPTVHRGCLFLDVAPPCSCPLSSSAFCGQSLTQCSPHPIPPSPTPNPKPKLLNTKGIHLRLAGSATKAPPPTSPNRPRTAINLAGLSLCAVSLTRRHKQGPFDVPGGLPCLALAQPRQGDPTHCPLSSKLAAWAAPFVRRVSVGRFAQPRRPPHRLLLARHSHAVDTPAPPFLSALPPFHGNFHSPSYNTVSAATSQVLSHCPCAQSLAPVPRVPSARLVASSRQCHRSQQPARPLTQLAQQPELSLPTCRPTCCSRTKPNTNTNTTAARQRAQPPQGARTFKGRLCSARNPFPNVASICSKQGPSKAPHPPIHASGCCDRTVPPPIASPVSAQPPGIATVPEG